MAEGSTGESKKRVDWVLPIAQNLPTEDLPSLDLGNVDKKPGFEIVSKRTPGGRHIVDVSQVVVEGMPAPRENPPGPPKKA
jgi:hypothetical protein